MARNIPLVGVTLSPQVKANSEWYKFAFNKSNSITPSSPPPSSLFSNITNRSYSFSTRRGRTYELGRIEAGECNLKVNNSDSLFDPSNTSGAFYPNLLPFRPLQVTCAYPVTGNILNDNNLSPLGSSDSRLSVCASDANFEQGIINWYVLSGTKPTIDGNSYFNNAAMRVYLNTTTLLDVPVVAGKQITVSMYQCFNGITGTGNFKIYDGGYYAPFTFQNVSYSAPNPSATVAFTSGNTSYARYSATITPVSSKITIAVSSSSGTDLFIDGVQVEFGSSASTFTTTGSVIYNLFNGFVERYPQSYQAPNRGEANLVATDALASMSQVNLMSLYQSLLLQDSSTALYYYPLSDDENAVSAGNASAYKQLPLNKLPYVLDSKITFGDNAAATGVVGAGTNGVTFYGIDNPSDFPLIGTYLANLSVQDVLFSTGKSYTFNLWAKLGMYANDILFLANFNGARNIANNDFVFGIGTNALGKLCVKVVAYSTVYGDQNLAVQPNVVDTTKWQFISLKVTDNGGGSYTFDLTVNGTTTSATLTSALPNAEVKTFIIGGSGNALSTVGTTLAHFSVHRGAIDTNAYYATGAYAQYTNNSSAEQTGTRFTNTLNQYSGFKYLPTYNDLGVSQMQQFSPTDTNLVDYLQSISDTEGGEWYVDGEGYVTFKNRHSRLKKFTPKVTFGDGVGETAYDGGSLVINYDPTYVYNDITVARNGGSTATAQDDDSLVNYFPRSYQRTIFNLADSEALDAAYFLLSRYKQPQSRPEVITLTPARNPSIWSDVLGLEIGDLVRVKKRPIGGVAINTDCFIERIEHSFDGQTGDWVTQIALSPVFKYYWNLSALRIAVGSGGANNLGIYKSNTAGYVSKTSDFCAGQLLQGYDNNNGYNIIAVVAGAATETATDINVPIIRVGYFLTDAFSFTNIKSSALAGSILLDKTATCALATSALNGTSGKYLINGEIISGSVTGSTLTITARAQNSTKQGIAGTDSSGAYSYSHLSGSPIYYLDAVSITPTAGDTWYEILPNQLSRIPYQIGTITQDNYSQLGSWFNTLNTGTYTNSAGTVKYSTFTVNPLTDYINYPQSNIACGQILSVVNASNVAESFAVVGIAPPASDNSWTVSGYKVVKGAMALAANVGIDATTITFTSAVTASVILIGQEFMTVTAGSGTTSLTVRRGTPDVAAWGILNVAPHQIGDDVYVVTNAGCSGTYTAGSAIIEGYNQITPVTGSARLGY